MNIEQLKYIVEVEKTKSITTAAKNLHVTQSGISRAISSLEGELGIYLFNRLRTGVEATIDGKELIKDAEDIVLRIQEFEEKALKKQQKLKISAIHGLSNTILLDSYQAFQENYSQTSVDIVEDSAEAIIDSVKQGSTHVGLINVYESMIKEHNDLLFDILFYSKVYVLVSKQSPIALLEYITPHDLEGYPIVIYNSTYVREFFQELSEKYASVNILFETNSRDVINKMVAEGKAINFIFDPTLKNEYIILDKEIISRPFMIDSNPVKIPMGYVVSKKNTTKIVKTFLDIIKDQIENY